jgi:hypothetical protein
MVTAQRTVRQVLISLSPRRSALSESAKRLFWGVLERAMRDSQSTRLSLS